MTLCMYGVLTKGLYLLGSRLFGSSEGLLYHGLFAAINRFLEMCPLIPMDQLCPVDDVYAPLGPKSLSGWLTILCMEWISFKVLVWSTYIPWMQFQPSSTDITCGYTKRSGTRQY